ncbi:lysylphosphatidylglycerol synthase transmembrane domain-containing protein [Cellulomonas sp. URHD0024]|uniref:lysylphosphatidylglycerol synthase transmembrane domain-containing protein n=1 Tax=Cellulomonas sp. URHD0024 TaxID=1302620 RepID=UPI00040F99BC|nr:lysylphosphatidylglycerol synthase transmembrane domain-containing protein [Cellulomonas sp. URHD0024]
MSATPSARRAAAKDPAVAESVAGAAGSVAGADDAPAVLADETVDGLVADERPASRIEIVDIPSARVHHPSDLLGMILSALAVVLVMAMATYAHNTTTGVAEDVQGFATLLSQILFVPVQVLEGFVTLVVPLAVITELAFRRLGRQLLEGLLAALVAVLLNEIVRYGVEHLATDALAVGLSIREAGEWVVTLPGYVAMLVGLLTVVGPRSRRRTVKWSWNLLWVATGVLLITAGVSLPGLLVSFFLGRVAGLGVRYLSGVQSERAYGESLVSGVRRAGFEPARIVRVADPTTDAEAADSKVPVPDLGTDPAARALTRSTRDRVYALTTDSGDDLDLVVIDGDRQVVGMLTRLWRTLRMRGIEGRSVVSLRQAAERAALLAYAARAAGVRTPKLLSLAEAEDSMLLVQEQPGRAVPLGSLEPERFTDDLLAEIWAQLRLAHEAGIAHRALTSDVILVEDVVGRPVVWITSWELGDVASSELARRMDVTQLVALLALRVGAARAVGSAADVLPDQDIGAIGPLLQTISLPRLTRDEMRAHKEVLTELRSALVARLPEADVEPQQLIRFGARSVLTVVVPIVALLFVITTINIDEISHALSKSDWRWTALAFALGMLTLVGAALAFVAFSPVKLQLWRTILVQTAAAFVALAAPAGLGPAALNLRMLTKRGVSATLSAATVALVQVSQLIVTLGLVVVLTLASGNNESPLPISPAVLIVVGIVAALVAASLLIPRVRQWVLAKTLPTLRQTWPRLIEVVGQPWRLILALAGNLLMTLGFIFAFYASMEAFGQHATLIQVALVYLLGNTTGALVPTPGGVGTIEFALAAYLASVTGINAGVATSIAIVFRVVTYWLRIPIGWVAMQYLQKRGEL